MMDITARGFLFPELTEPSRVDRSYIHLINEATRP
jgi:hypothetical protein